MKLDCIDVSKRFGSVTALDRLNLHLEDRRIHGLLGRNGAGKTTLLRMMGNLIQPSDGQLLLEGKPLWGKSAGTAADFPVDRKILVF